MAAPVQNVDTGKLLRSNADVQVDLQYSIYQNSLNSLTSLDLAKRVILLPTDDMSRRCPEWSIQRVDTENMKMMPIERRHLPRLASVERYFNIGGPISGLCRNLVPLASPVDTPYNNWRIRYAAIDVNITVVPRLSGSGQVIEIDVGTANLVQTWADFFCRFLLPLLPASAVSFIDTYGGIHPLSANPATAEVHVANLNIVPGFLPAVPGILDFDAIINGISNHQRLLTSFDELLQQLAIFVDSDSVIRDEFTEHLGLYVGCCISAAYRMRFSNPDGTFGFQSIVDYGFDNTAAIADSSTNAILSLLRLRVVTTGRMTSLVLAEPTWLVRGFVDKRAYKIVESGLYRRLWSDTTEGRVVKQMNNLLSQILSSEVELYGGARVNACTQIARRLPKDLSLLTFISRGTRDTRLRIKIPDSSEQNIELYSLFNLLSMFRPGEILSLRGGIGGNFAIYRAANWIFNYSGEAARPNEVAMLNPASNLDLLYAASGGVEMTLTVRAGDFATRAYSPVLRVRTKDAMRDSDHKTGASLANLLNTLVRHRLEGNNT